MDGLNQNVGRSFSALVAGKWFGKMIDNGVPRNTIENRSNVSLEKLLDADARISRPDFQQLIKCGYELSADETLALQVGAAATPEDMGIVGHMLLNCANLVEVLNILVQYSQLLLNMDVHFAEKKDHYTLEMISSQSGPYEIDNSPLIRYRVESAVAWIVTILRYFKNDLTPYELFFKHSRPGYFRTYRKIFETGLHFNQPTNKMLFHKNDFNISSGKSNPYLLRLYRKHADQLLKELQSPESLEQQIEKIISDHLVSQTVNLEMVADCLQVNRWKLVRLLKERSRNFQQIQDNVRYKLARAYLENKQVQIGEIHELLGYSEPSAFTRAFKRWSGLSPREYQQRYSAQSAAAPAKTASRPVY